MEKISLAVEPGLTELPLDSLLESRLPREMLLLEMRTAKPVGAAIVLRGAGASLEVVPAATEIKEGVFLPVAGFDYFISNLSTDATDLSLELVGPEGNTLASAREQGLGVFETRHLDLLSLFKNQDIEMAAHVRFVADQSIAGFAVVSKDLQGRGEGVITDRAATATLAEKSASFIWPVEGNDRGRLGNDFAHYNYVSTKEYHTGIDIGAAAGTKVFAAGSGAVVEIQENDAGGPSCDNKRFCDHGYGNTIIIQHSLPDGQNIYTQYSHLSWIDPELLEKCGPGGSKKRHICPSLVQVTAGQTVAKVGCSRYGLTKCDKDFSSHLHFETKTFGTLGTKNDDQGEFGYSPSHPDSYGYKDPISFLHSLSSRSGTVRLADNSVCFRVGPGGAGSTAYRRIGCGPAVTSLGPVFNSLAVSGSTSTPVCQRGWYQIAPIQGGGFPDTTNGDPDDTISEAWVCGDFLEEADHGNSFEFSAAAYPVSESTRTVTITVVRTGASAAVAKVSYVTSGGTASRGIDYRFASGDLNFGAGEKSKTFSVAIIPDSLTESDETINLALSGPTEGASLGALKNAVITILDDDHGPKLEFSSANVNVRENAGSVTVTVNRVGPAGSTVDVGYSTESGSAGGDVDFKQRSGRLTFVTGATLRTITVPILDDFLREGAETFSLRLFDASAGASIGKQDRLTVLIEDDETLVTPPFVERVSPASYPASSGSQTMTIQGSNFQNGAALIFGPPTGPNIPSNPAKLTFVSSSQLSYQFNNGNQVGTWTVMVKNPDGQQSNAAPFTVQAQSGSTPSISSVSPNPVPGLNSSQTLTIYGGNFVSGATVTLKNLANGGTYSKSTNYSNSGQLSLSANFTNNTATWSAQVINPNGNSSNVFNFQVQTSSSSLPLISSVSPNPVTGSNSSQPFTIFGGNFVVGANVTLRDLSAGQTFPNRAASSFSSTQIVINPTFTTAAHTWSVEVINPDGKSSGQYQFQVVSPSAPSPVIYSVSPNPVTGSNSAQPFTVYGNNFVSGANVTLRDLSAGQTFPDRAPSSFSSTQIVLNPTFTAAAHTWSVEVTNPDGKSSGQFQFQVVAPNAAAPVISSVSPNPVTGSNSSQPFTIFGSNFVSGANVTLRDLSTGQTFPDRAPSSFSNTKIVLSPTFTTAAHTWSVEVINPDGKSSGQFQFQVVAPGAAAPSISSVSPNPVTGSNSSQPFTIYGSSFVSGANVTLRDLSAGQTFPNRAASSFSSTQIVVNPTFTTAAHTWSVEVINPDGKSSGQYQFQVVAPSAAAPSISSVSPNPVTGSNSSQPFTIYGSNFVSGANVTLRDLSAGQTFPNRAASSFSSTQIVINPTFTTA
ncbi:MAG TPA: Calx-beta domain-containing protein, partial [Thermoanaerobaculia bacterium]|nr:Calx-beta domain-containing protein [Thermoanaerobaculia bacterium]